MPDSELSNEAALHTIHSNPHLFKIVTPINVDAFEALLSTHPNRILVDSVCFSLRHGVWPHANIDPESPVTYDYSARSLLDEGVEFVHRQRDKEIELDRFSPAFGTDLLPGMHSCPIGVVPKPNTNKLRLVTDQSAGPYSLNSFIPKAEGSVRMDNLHDFGKFLRHIIHIHKRPPPWLLKSDASQAFRRIPVCFLWQIRQIVTIDGQRHVDHCMVFGNRSSPRIWCTFMGLVI
jgi:hypothetical protein